MCLVQELLRESPCLLRVGLVGDVVPLENAAGPVAGDLHDHGLGNAGAPEIPHGSPPKIVEQQLWSAKIPDRAPATSFKQPP